MRIIEAPELQVPAVQPKSEKKRKLRESGVKEEDLGPEDVKPSRKALLAARLKDLEVSTCLSSCDLCDLC
jgi:hypothetical protein